MNWSRYISLEDVPDTSRKLYQSSSYNREGVDVLWNSRRKHGYLSLSCQAPEHLAGTRGFGAAVPSSQTSLEQSYARVAN